MGDGAKEERERRERDGAGEGDDTRACGREGRPKTRDSERVGIREVQHGELLRSR